MVKSEFHQEQEPPVDGVDTPPYQMRYRWIMLLLAWLLYWCFGIVVRSIAPLVTPILEELNISYTQMGIVLGAWPLTYIAVAAIGGAIIDRWGIRKSLFVGIVIIGLSAALRYFADGFVILFLCVALLGIGGPMISIGCPKTVAEWFRGKERGTAVGFYMTGPWLGGLTAYSLANSVIMPLVRYSWRLTFVVFSLPAFAAALLWWFLSREAKSTEATKKVGIIKVFTDLIGIRNVQLIIIMGFLLMSVAHGFNDWLPKILETGGLPLAVAGFAASIPLITGIPVVLFLPRLVPPHLRGRTIALMSFLFAIVILIIATTSGATLVAGLIFQGIVYTAIFPLLVLFLMDIPEVSSKYMGAATGMLFCISEIGGFGGPFVMGAVRDLTGDFMTGASLLAVLAVSMSFMALLLKTK
ncbi:CynX/NimT family MFS transporter [Chloroflexota bacterium]